MLTCVLLGPVERYDSDSYTKNVNRTDQTSPLAHLNVDVKQTKPKLDGNTFELVVAVLVWRSCFVIGGDLVCVW